MHWRLLGEDESMAPEPAANQIFVEWIRIEQLIPFGNAVEEEYFLHSKYRMESEPLRIRPEMQAPGVAINTATITETKMVTHFKVNVISVELFKCVHLNATLLGENGDYVGVRYFIVEGDEYLAWNNDDQYLINLVAQKLGFTLA
jgi:hypothetical protein